MLRQQPRSPWMTSERIGNASLVKLTTTSVLDEQVVQAIGRHLFDIADQFDPCLMVLDFQPVERVTSTLVGKLIALNKKIQSSGGKLILCGVSQKLLEVFEILRLSSLFKICADEQEALMAF